MLVPDSSMPELPVAFRVLIRGLRWGLITFLPQFTFPLVAVSSPSFALLASQSPITTEEVSSELSLCVFFRCLLP